MPATTTRAITASPYHLYNLRRNPFGELTGQERAELAVLDVEPWLDLLRNDRIVVQFVGPCGHGKSTHLLAIHRQLSAAALVYLPEVGPHPPIPDDRPLLIDEAQRLSSWKLRRVLSAGGPLVLGTHVDLSKAIHRGRLRAVTIELDKGVSPLRLVEILNRRIEASRLGEGPLPYVDTEFVISLQREFDSNIRAIEHFLYEQFQSCAREQRTWPPAN